MLITKRDVERMVSERSGIKMVTIESVLNTYHDVLCDINLSGNTVALGKLGTLGNSAIKAKDEQRITGGKWGDQTVPAQPEHNRPNFKFRAAHSKAMKEKTLGNQYPNG